MKGSGFKEFGEDLRTRRSQSLACYSSLLLAAEGSGGLGSVGLTRARVFTLNGWFHPRSATTCLSREGLFIGLPEKQITCACNTVDQVGVPIGIAGLGKAANLCHDVARNSKPDTPKPKTPQTSILPPKPENLNPPQPYSILPNDTPKSGAGISPAASSGS